MTPSPKWSLNRQHLVEVTTTTSSRAKIGILADCDKETIEVFKRWQRVCGVKDPNPPAVHTLNKLTELRVNLAAIAIKKTKDPWDILARDWQALGDGGP